MKHIIFLLCLLPLGILAQPGHYDKVNLQTDSFRFIKLPKLKGEPYFLVRDSFFAQKGFVVNNAQQYYQTFAQYLPDSLPAIDFKQYLLRPVSRCIYRLPARSPEDSMQECGHRQACFYKLDWFLVRRKQ